MGARVSRSIGFLAGRQDAPEEIWDMQINAFTRFANREQRTGPHCYEVEKRNKEVVITRRSRIRCRRGEHGEARGVIRCSHAHTVMDVVEFIRALKKISHIHISDTKDGKVHVLMGQGEIAFGAVLEALKEKYDGALVIEGWNPKDEIGMVEKSTAFLKPS
jgi:sugar phosphate isomerase/epimerase